MARREHSKSKVSPVRPVSQSRAMLALVALTVLLAAAWWIRRPTQMQPTAPLKASTPLASKSVVAEASTNEPAVPDVDKSTELMNQGTAELKAKHFETATSLFRQAIKLNPEDEDGYYNLGLALAAQGLKEEARKSYEQALKLFPDYAEAHNNLGNLLVKEGKYEEAIAHFTEAIKNAPESASAQNNLGNALANQGKIAEAVGYFNKAIQLKPDYVEPRYNLGNTYLMQGRTSEAIEEYSRILRIDPNFTPARRALNKAQARMEPGAPGLAKP